MTAEVHGLLGAYVLDAVSTRERSCFDEHLAACSTCRREVIELREVAAELTLLAAANPPAYTRPVRCLRWPRSGFTRRYP